jgi:hypothetical protein
MYHVVPDGFSISLCSKFKLCLTNNTWFLSLKHVQTIPPPKHSVAPGIANIYQFMAWKFPDKINKDCGPLEAARRWISDEACIPVERPLYGKGFDGSGEAGTWMSFFHVWKWSASWFITFPTKTAVLDFGVLRQSLIYHIPDIPVCFTLPHPHVTSLALSKIQHSIPASDIFRSQLPWYLIYTFFEGEHDGLTQDRACQ